MEKLTYEKISKMFVDQEIEWEQNGRWFHIVRKQNGEALTPLIHYNLLDSLYNENDIWDEISYEKYLNYTEEELDLLNTMSVLEGKKIGRYE